MHLHKATEYAIRCLVYMAQDPTQVYSVKLLAEQLGLPYKFLARVFGSLGQAGLVVATRGKSGGYRIERLLGDITLLEIISVSEGPDDFVRCVLGFEHCSDASPCPMHKHWVEHREKLNEMARGLTLVDLVGSGATRF